MFTTAVLRSGINFVAQLLGQHEKEVLKVLRTHLHFERPEHLVNGPCGDFFTCTALCCQKLTNQSQVNWVILIDDVWSTRL